MAVITNSLLEVNTYYKAEVVMLFMGTVPVHSTLFSQT